MIELAEMRKTFLAGLPPMLEASGAALEIEGPPDPPASSLDGPLDGPPEPPPAFYEGLNATRMTTSTTSTSAPEEIVSANGAWNC